MTITRGQFMAASFFTTEHAETGFAGRGRRWEIFASRSHRPFAQIGVGDSPELDPKGFLRTDFQRPAEWFYHLAALASARQSRQYAARQIPPATAKVPPLVKLAFTPPATFDTMTGDQSSPGCEMFGFKRGTIRLPDGLASIGEGAFRGCWHLTGIEIPDSVTNIGTWAFCECHGLAQVRLPKRLVEIPDGLFCRTSFEWSKGLERVEIPPGVKRVGKYAFTGCVGLKEVVIPDSVEVIDDCAFYGCKMLVRPKLPPSVRMGKHVFE